MSNKSHLQVKELRLDGCHYFSQAAGERNLELPICKREGPRPGKLLRSEVQKSSSEDKEVCGSG